ncbi:unnamed protein product [Symbiodinium sp. CCMP2592]|nr:unnamed protein product [Symbiodinium sp. CCMP2592]
MEGRGRPSYFNIGDVPGEPGMIRRNSRSDAAPPYQRPRASSVPRGAAFSPVSNLSALERGMHPTGSPVVGSPAGSPNPLGGVLPPLPGLPEFGGVSPVNAPSPPTVETFLYQTVQQQQQVAQLTSLVQALVSREVPAPPTARGKGHGGELSSISDSSGKMEVDEGGAPIRNPKAEAYVPKLPAIDGGKMSKGRRSEIEGWAEFLEQFLPWIALFDDRIPEELHRSIASEVTIKQSSLEKGQSVRSTRTFLYLKQALQGFARGLDLVKQVEKEQLGSPAGYECMRRLHQELSVASRIEASTLRNEALQYRASTPANRPLDMFRNIQLELAKFTRLTAGFPDLALSEADRCMIVLRNLDVEVKKYVLLHARVDSMDQLETALKFYDANLKILNFQEKEGKGAAKDHANALTFGDKGKGKKGDKGKEEKGKGKDKGKDNKKGNEKGKEEKGKGGKDKGKDKGKTAAAKDGKQGSGNDKEKEKEKAERLKNVAAASLEPQIFAAAVDLSCPVVELDEDDCSDFSQEDWEEFVASYECAWSEPVVLEGGEPVALEGSMLHVALENFPCDNPNRATVELAESRGVPNRTTVKLAESHQVPDRTTVELAESPELSLEAGRFVADFQNVVEHDMLHVVGRADHGMVAHETAAASQQHDTMDWWLVDSGASAHIINEDTLSRVHVVSHSESASECVSATGDSIGVRRSAVVRVPFVLVSGETVVTELQVLVAPVKFNLLSLGRLLGKSWVVDFLPSFKVEAAGYVLRTRWVSNCGWVFSSAVELDRSVAVAARASLKRSDGCESSSDSEQEWRLSGRRHLAEQHAATVTRTHEDFEGSTIAFTATSMVGLTPGQNLLLVPAAEVKKKTAEQAKAAAKAAAEKFVKERQESAQWAKEAEEAKKKRAAKAEAKQKAATEAAETEKKAATEATEAEKKAATEAVEAEKKAATEAKKRVAEAIEVPEVKKPKGSVARAKAEPSSGSKDPPQPLVKRQPKPPVVKAMPAKVRKIVLKSRAQRGIPGQTETALRMLSQRAREKKKQGYLMKAINNAMKKKAEEQKGPPVRRTLERHVKDHFAQIKGLEIPFVEVTISEVIKEPPGPPGSPMVPQPRTPPARAKVEAARAAKVPQIKVEGGLEINPPPPVPPRRRLPTPPRDPRSAGRGASAPSEWSPVSSLPPWSPVSSVPVDARARETPAETRAEEPPAERRAEELHIGDDGKIYNSRGEVVELESIEIDAHHPGISDGPSSLGLSLLMQEKVAFACEHDVAVELGEHACVGGLGEHDLQHGELLEHVGQDRPQRDRSEAHDSQSEAWLLRGDRELLLQESWGKLEREHVLRSHVPYNASCPQCVQGRGLEPARSQDRPQDSGMREVQIDKFFYKGLAFLVLVLVGAFALGVVPYREVSGSRGPAAKEAMLSDMSAWSRSVGLVGVAPSELTVSVKSDIEGVVKNLAQSFADGLTAGAIEVVDAPVGRHAVVAERAVRTIKEGANTLCAGLEQVGLEPCGKGVTYLLMHVAQVYNRYQVHPGSALSPEQRCLKTTRGPHAAYVWGAAVLATPPPSLRDKITGRYGHAAYLGPEVGSGSHIVQFRLRDGTLKIARSARIRMLVPLTFEVSSLKGVCRMLPGRRDDSQKKLPESSGDNVRDLPLPNTATRGPPPEWIEENGRTPRCRACRLRGFPADKAWHTQKCRDRYAEFVRNSFDPSRAILDQAPIEEEVTGRDDLGAGFGVDLGLEVPDDLDPFPNFPLDEDLAEYEPSLPGVENEIELGEELEQIEAPSPGELDFMQVDPEPLEALPEEEREAMVSSMMYRESISFAGASVCFAGAATKVVTPQDLNWVNVLTVSERDDGASAQTLLELKAIFAEQIKKKGFVFLWASTPCTGGCPYQRLRARDPAYRRGRLAQHWRLHRKLWRSLVELTSFVHAWAIEWPRACAYWSWRQTEHFLSSRPYVLHDVPVDGCALDMRGRDHLLIAKRWRVVTTHPAVAESIRVYRCSGKHEHSKDFDLKNTQHYPVELVKSFFEALTFKMSLAPFAAERAMVFGLVVEVQEKLLEAVQDLLSFLPRQVTMINSKIDATRAHSLGIDRARGRHVAGLFNLRSLPVDDPLLPASSRSATDETILVVAFYGQAGNASCLLVMNVRVAGLREHEIAVAGLQEPETARVPQQETQSKGVVTMARDGRESGFAVSQEKDARLATLTPHPVDRSKGRVNHAADQAAGSCMQNRLSGSQREHWHQQCDQVRDWELTTTRLAAAAAERLDKHVKSVPLDDAEPAGARP